MNPYRTADQRDTYLVFDVFCTKCFTWGLHEIYEPYDEEISPLCRECFELWKKENDLEYGFRKRGEVSWPVSFIKLGRNPKEYLIVEDKK